MKKIVLLMCAVLLAAPLCAKAKKVVINSIADLEGKKIGVQTGTTGELFVMDEVKDAKVVSFKSGIDAALDLKNGAIDCVVIDDLPAQEIVKKNPKLKIIRDPYFSANKEEYAIAVKKGNTKLLSKIDETITTMQKNGDYEKLVNAFMPADGNIKIPESEATSGETVVLGTNAAFPPFEYVSGKKIVGFDITMGERIAKTAGMKLEVLDMAFDSLIPALQAGTIDFIAAGMSVTEERKKNVDFSDTYFASEQVIIVRK